MFTVLIPARYASTRLPGKALADIAGKPMVVRVAENARKSGARRVVIATDDERIRAVAGAYDVEAILTRTDHPTGTDRLAEAAAALGLADDEIVVNVQGDEPLLAPELIRGVAVLLASRPDAAIATACHPIVDVDEAFNPNIVKVVLDARGNALYFSRATIPWRAMRSRGRARGLPAGCRFPSLRPVRLSCRLPSPVSGARARPIERSRRWSNYGRSGTASASSSRSRPVRRRPASIPRRTSRACAHCTRAGFDRWACER